MRIIRAAKQVQEIEINCGKCKSTLGITQSDVKPDYGSYNIICPVCGHLNKYTYASDLFPWIMEDNDNDRKLQSDNSMRVNTL